MVQAASDTTVSFLPSPLTEHEVGETYRGVLGRDPESADVVKSHIARHAILSDLLTEVLASDEFRRRKGQENDVVMAALRDAFWKPAGSIEHDVSQDVMTQLVERIRQQWTKLGESDPHWSVLTHDRYRSGRLDDAAIAEFYASGAPSAGIIDLFEQRTGVNASRGVCLELGCGVGRITEHLANRFDRVIGVDISPGNLELCRHRMAAIGRENVDLRQISRLEDFDSMPEIDFFYSVIVLQHNSPPIQKAILRTLLGKVKAGGGALFQIPTEMPGYSFEARSYLDTSPPEMEIHGLPKAVVLEEIRRAGLQVIDLLPDSWIDVFGSYTFYAVKPA